MISSILKGSAILAILSSAAFSAGQDIQVQVNGQAVTFPDVRPQKIGIVVMVPLRTVCEQMGDEVTWDPSAQTVTCTGNGSTAVLTLGDSEARFNGQMRYLDLPPTMRGDRILVPMRFLGDGMGNTVAWNQDDNLVAISTGPSASTSTVPPAEKTVTLNQDEVIPLTLDTALDSRTSSVGDTFTASVSAGDAAEYAGIPEGTKIAGHVAAVQPMQGDQPAILDLAFDRVEFPNGTSEQIDGSLVSLDEQFVMKGDDGVYQAQSSGKTYSRMIFAGYGDPNGQLVGVTIAQPVDSATLPDVLPQIEQQTRGDERQPTDITVSNGENLGLRINSTDTVTL